MKRISVCLLLISLIFSCKNAERKDTPKIPSVQEKEVKLNVAYIGTYTKKEGHVDGKAEGIYTIYQNADNGTIRFGKTVASVINPSFVITSRDRKNLYAVSELGPKDGDFGFVHSFTINDDHSLTEIGKISTGSYAPCHITEDATGYYVFVANYVGGVVMMYEKEKDGSLKEKQKITLEDPDNSHPHSVNIAANNKYVYISDLGKSRIYKYVLDVETGTLIPHTNPYIQLKDGTGPRHFEFSASQKFAFSINEHSSTISTFKIAESGELSSINEITTLPEDFTGKNSTADIHLHPSGKFLYGSN
ncbi:MAG TPA: beta-propeller fold lactonase family protein, partial [Gillisia sp.]|nr:beta-propeller fold lactonase family protein [Gillisia sp.]